MLQGCKMDYTFPKATCNTRGHTDLLIKCSCGFEERVSHGRQSDVNSIVMLHRVDKIEEWINDHKYGVSS